MHSLIDTLLEAYIAVILTVEYFWGKPDVVIKNAEKQQKRLKPKKEVIPYEKEMD